MDRLLLDTHALLWWRAESARLSSAAHTAIAAPRPSIDVGAAAGWAIAPKVRLGKLPAAPELLRDLAAIVAAQGFDALDALPVTLPHGLPAGRHDLPPRDPFDRLPDTQAELAGLTVVSLDPARLQFPCRVLW